MVPWVMMFVGTMVMLGLPPSAAARVQTEIGLQPEDLPIQYDLVAAERLDVGRQLEAQYTVFSKRSPAEPGPMTIASYVVLPPAVETAHLAESPVGFRQAPHQTALEIILAGLESDRSESPQEITGPAIGEDTRWFRAEGSGAGGVGTTYIVAFGAGDGAALLQAWSPDRTADASDLVPLAEVVASRLQAPSLERGPFGPFGPGNRGFGDEDL
jgi:hypothetical protein